MTKSELIEIITAKQKHLPAKDVELALKQILEIMSDALSQGERIEIRGFGSFSLHFRPPRQGRNPKTGEAVALSGKYVPHFKPGKDLRERVNDGAGPPDPRLSRWLGAGCRAPYRVPRARTCYRRRRVRAASTAAGAGLRPGRARGLVSRPPQRRRAHRAAAARLLRRASTT